MTNQTIPPCPKCGNMPELINGAFGTCFGCKKCDIAAPRRDRWELLVRDVLGRACRELGVETVEQFNVIVRMACELRNMTAIHDYEEQVYQKIVPEIRAEYE